MSEAKQDKQQIVLTVDVLDQILERQDKRQIELIQELKKPTVLEQKELDKQAKEQQQAQDARKQESAQIRKMHENKIYTQNHICTHKRRDGSNRTVWVSEGDNEPGYLLCQKCQGVIRPGNKPDDYTGNAIFNTPLFNSLFQIGSQSGILD